MSKLEVFLDHQSSTPVLKEVVDAMLPYMTKWFGNPGSQHSHGLRARDAVEESRRRVAAMIGAGNPEDIIFTSGATESANLAIKGTALASRSRGNHIILSSIEHPAILNSALWLETQGFACTRVGCDREGLIDPGEIKAAITSKTVLIAVHHANHDIGAIQEVAAISNIARERGIPVFCDASCSGGWVPIDVAKFGVQLLSLAPHRFYGPKGAGILYRHRQARIESQIHGGKQEDGKRAGTENVPAIVGAGVACEAAVRDLKQRLAAIEPLQRQLIEGLLEIAGSRLNGPKPGHAISRGGTAKRSPVNVNVSFGGVEGESLLLLCDMQGITLGSGPSCVAQNLKKPYVLEAIGLNDEEARGNIVMTLGAGNTREQINYVLETLPKLVEKLRSMSPSWGSSKFKV